MPKINHPISTCFWFDTQAEAATDFYVSIFKNAKKTTITRYGKEGFEHHGMPTGSVMTATIELEGQQFTGLNGGPVFKQNPSISFFVICDTEDEINELWAALSKDGDVLMPLNKYEWSDKYGWLQDRFGVSWQLTIGMAAELTQKISPSLLFVNERSGRAEEAVQFYTSTFPNSSIHTLSRYPTDAGKLQYASFQLNGQQFNAMDSTLKHDFGFNEAVSFVISCKEQQEVDYYWEKLKEGGNPNAQQCGWLKDKFGVSWQVVPAELFEMLQDPDPKKVQRATHAFMQMKKLDIDVIRKAFNAQ